MENPAITATAGPANLDVIDFSKGTPTGFGTVAQRLLASGMNIASLRTLDVLAKEEWLLYDTTVINVARQRLVAVADLLDRGLRFDLANGLGTTAIQWDNISDMDPAEITMAGVTEAQNDRMLFALNSLPVPIVHKDFKINIRTLQSSRRRGEPLDTTQAAMAARLVSEGIEQMLFKGSALQEFGHYPSSLFGIPGYTNFTKRNVGSLTNDWLTNVTTPPPYLGETIVADILRMMQALQNQHMYGPYMLYVPVPVAVKWGDDYKQYSERTIMERVLAIPGIMGVRGTENLPTSPKTQVVLVQMTSDTVDEVVGMQPTTIMWETQGGMVVNFKVMAIMVPRLKADYKSQCGLAHYTQP